MRSIWWTLSALSLGLVVAGCFSSPSFEASDEGDSGGVVADDGGDTTAADPGAVDVRDVEVADVAPPDTATPDAVADAVDALGDEGTETGGCADEAPLCARQAGVCAGQRAARCEGGAWAPCGEPEYGRHPLYQAVEAACDLVDNDCDGDTDEDLGPVCACGNGLCEAALGEDAATCPCDCSVCGDGTCSPCGESPARCPEDCCGGAGGAGCGDGVCLGYACGEDPQTCAADCGAICGADSDGDGEACDRGESPQTCPQDCKWKACGNGVCEGGEGEGGADPCPADCAPTCGDCVCEGGEDYRSCPGDCGFCGDGSCSHCDALREDATRCPADCCAVDDPDCVGASPLCATPGDCDRDGLADDYEAARGLDPHHPDSDGDGVLDGADNCPLHFNADQADGDGDGAGDVCDGGCVPSCGPRECGSDGCGGTCATCTGGAVCRAGVCVRQGELDRCTGKICGGDGLGGHCGFCPAGESCKDGACVACSPDCDGKACGPDGCGGTCGTCPGCDGPAPGLCASDGSCRAVCCPDCGGRVCGDDGCGGSCGACDDGDPCTDDRCGAAGLCSAAPNTAPCDADGDPCTVGDACAGGACVAGAAMACDDENPCTADACVDGDCVFDSAPRDGEDCDADGSECTVGDTCAGGVCVAGAVRECASEDPCFDAACDPAEGCRSTPNEAPCDDGDACTTGDTCAGGVCVGGPAPDCADANPCTVARCLPASGCEQAVDDELCVGSAEITPEAGGEVVAGPSGARLSAAAGAVSVAVTVTMSYEAALKAAPVEGAGDGVRAVAPFRLEPAGQAFLQPVTVVIPTLGVPLEGGAAVLILLYDVGTGVWRGARSTGGTEIVGTAAGDGASVTFATDHFSVFALGVGADACAPQCPDGYCGDDRCGAPCMDCDDGDACNGAETCEQGACAPGDPLDCDDRNPCTDDRCSEGVCAYAANTAACDDGDLCTVDDVCVDEACQPGEAMDCADGDPCTDDVCDGGACSNPFNEAPCDDGDPCTTPDTCSGGSCGGPNTCQCRDAGDCADENPCTDEVCDPDGRCRYTHNSAPCDDGDACTLTDLCAGGVCVGSGARDCSDAFDCTIDRCTATGGATFECAHDLDENRCLVDGECFVGGQVGPDNGCVSCDPVSATRAFTPHDDGTPCDAGGGPGSGACAEAVCESASACGDGDCAFDEGPGGCPADCLQDYVRIPAGQFTMGSPPSEIGRDDDEGPEHPVRFWSDLWVKTTPVTQAEWAAVMGDGLAAADAECGPDCPMNGVSWWDAAAWCNQRSLDEGLSPCYQLEGCPEVGAGQSCTRGSLSTDGGIPQICEGYRLPTEAEWEYAARAGSTTAYYSGPATRTDVDERASRIGEYADEEGAGLAPVRQRVANAWGLFDMAGNVFEWTGDAAPKRTYDGALVDAEDPARPTVTAKAVVRGGAFDRAASELRSANRDESGTTPGAAARSVYGFRPVRSVRATAPCATDVDCDDGNPCTVGQCGDGGHCSVIPNPCDDGNACTDDWCDASLGGAGCVHDAFADGGGCDVGDGPGSGVCFGAVCIPPPRCGDGVCTGGEDETGCSPDCAPPGFAYIPAGTFTWGYPPEELIRPSQSTRELTLSRGFYVGTAEVTRADWDAMMTELGAVTNPTQGCTLDDCPLNSVNWWEAAEYCNALSRSEGLPECYDLDCHPLASKPGDGRSCDGVTVTAADGNPYECTGYRLPTLSEWEYAARAGAQTTFYSGMLTAPGCPTVDPALGAIAVYSCNGRHQPEPVAGRPANAWGLFDVHGNVSEWVYDTGLSYPEPAYTDYYRDSDDNRRYFKGGAYNDESPTCMASRGFTDPTGRVLPVRGFRVVRTAPPAPACATAADCDDANVCTVDECDGGVCRHRPNPCDDGNECTFDTCDATFEGAGCLHHAVYREGDLCDAGRGEETGQCAAGACELALVCGDGHCDPGEGPDCSADCLPGFGYVPPGRFTMGSPADELGRGNDEAPREVTVTRGFWMKETEVTDGEWKALLPQMGGTKSPSASPDVCGFICDVAGTATLPVENLTWWEALAWCNAKSRSEGLDPCYDLDCPDHAQPAGEGRVCDGVAVNAPGGDPRLCEGYRLPTEAEWERAARAGSTTAFANGPIDHANCDDSRLEDVAIYCGSSYLARGFGLDIPENVATLAANAHGLHDLAGNTAEWVWDWAGGAPSGPETDPLGPASGSARVVRGGHFESGADECRAAARGEQLPGVGSIHVGFRPVRSAPVEPACAEDADCDDGNPCTDDACTDGACDRAPVVCPDDGNPCTVAFCRAIEGDAGCVQDSLATEGDACGASTGVCSGGVCAVCGDGLREGNEGCDDGDLEAGDGCSDACAVEPRWSCVDATLAGGHIQDFPWTPAPHDLPSEWQVTADGMEVTELRDAGASIYDTGLQLGETYKVTVELSVQIDDDNDMVGFVIGYDRGEDRANDADYLVLQWKRVAQPWGGTEHPTGMTLARVTGPADGQDFWAFRGPVAQLARAATLGSSGWAPFNDYEFDFQRTATGLKIWVGGALQFDVAGDLPTGTLGLFALSQSQVRYRLVAPIGRSMCARSPTCDDGVWNGDEGDVDCGGAFCARCSLGDRCGDAADCQGGACSDGECALPGFSLAPAGRFTMGSPEGEPGRDSDEPQHEVSITRPFWLQSTSVTQQDWLAHIEAMGGTDNPSGGQSCGLDCPVENVTWWEALAYCNALSEAEGYSPCYQLEGCTGTPGQNYQCTGVSIPSTGGDPLRCVGYRLPTEAEWEYAARAGTQTAFFNGDITNTECSPLDPVLDTVGWYCANASSSKPVGGKPANAWGLRDMHGNTWDWVWDRFGAYEVSAQTDPLGPDIGGQRGRRGASYFEVARSCTSANRAGSTPDHRAVNIGFRVARTADQQLPPLPGPDIRRDSSRFAFRYELVSHPSAQDVDRNGHRDFANQADDGEVGPTLSGDGFARGGEALRLVSQPDPSQLWATAFPPGMPLTVEVRLRILTTGAEGSRGTFQVVLSQADGTFSSLYVARDGQKHNIAGTGNTDLGSHDNTDGFHVFRVARDVDGEMWFWRDGVLLNPNDAGIVQLVLGSTSGLTVGDGDAQVSGDWELDYIRLTTGAYAPPR